MPRKVTKTVRLHVVTNCHGCFHLSEPRHTPGSGFGQDFFCEAVKPPRIVDGYVEWDSEKRKDHDFPDWCPLEKRKVRE